MSDIKLYADLYDNALTEKEGDCTARPRINGTLYNADIARRIVEKRTEYRPETIENILTMADEEKSIGLAQRDECGRRRGPVPAADQRRFRQADRPVRSGQAYALCGLHSR